MARRMRRRSQQLSREVSMMLGEPYWPIIGCAIAGAATDGFGFLFMAR